MLCVVIPVAFPSSSLMISLFSDNNFLDLLKRDRRYKAEAYFFVFQALHYAQEKLHLGRLQKSETTGESRTDENNHANHVTGQDLSRAARDFALSQYGFLAKTVLEDIGIQKSEDIGEIVYNLIGINVMHKTAEDSPADFANIFDFSLAFEGQYQIS